MVHSEMTSGGGGESGAIYDGVAEALGAAGTGGNLGDTRPGAYLNYILYDKDYNFVDLGWTAVPASAMNAQQKISIPTVNIAHEGFIFVYLTLSAEAFRVGGAMKMRAICMCHLTISR